MEPTELPEDPSIMLAWKISSATRQTHCVKAKAVKEEKLKKRLAAGGPGGGIGRGGHGGRRQMGAPTIQRMAWSEPYKPPYYILAKKEEACMKHSNIKEDKKEERFKLLMEVTDKKLKLEERKAALEEKKVKIAANAKEAKMLTLNVDSLDADGRIIVQSVHYQMLQRQKISWRRRHRRRTRTRRMPTPRRQHHLDRGGDGWDYRSDRAKMHGLPE